MLDADPSRCVDGDSAGATASILRAAPSSSSPSVTLAS
jgi:hypothetical protein